MKTTFEKIDGLTRLTTFEMQMIMGGTDTKPSTGSSFWYDAAYLLGAITKGFVVFATEGGRNAGLTVH